MIYHYVSGHFCNKSQSMHVTIIATTTTIVTTIIMIIIIAFGQFLESKGVMIDNVIECCMLLLLITLIIQTLEPKTWQGCIYNILECVEHYDRLTHQVEAPIRESFRSVVVTNHQLGLSRPSQHCYFLLLLIPRL